MRHDDWYLARSRLAPLVRWVVLGAAVLATMSVSPPAPAHWLLLLGCWALILLEYRCARQRRVDALSVQAEQWFLWSAGERLPAQLLRYHVLGARFVVLTFGVSGRGVWRVNVFPDMLAKTDFRRLKLVLKVA